MNRLRNNESMKMTSRQRGFLHLPNDNIVKTIAVALSLCLVCSIVVSTAATLLKPKQVANKLIDKKRNIVEVAGLKDSGKSLEEAFQQIESRVVDLRTGEYAEDLDAATYDQLKASKDPAQSIKLSKQEDIAQIGRRANFASVYLMREGDDISQIIIPIKGYGLWSTMFGFVALESDAKTVSAVTFYEHGETPGLGGEIENKRWQQSWIGKQAINDQGQPVLRVIKGRVNPDVTGSESHIDGLAGATLTSNGVTNLLQFWLGENGFGPYLQRLRRDQSPSYSKYPSELIQNSNDQDTVALSSGQRG